MALQAMHVAYARQVYLEPGQATPTPVPAPTPSCPPAVFKDTHSICTGLQKHVAGDGSAAACQSNCCFDSSCKVWQWLDKTKGNASRPGGCWAGQCRSGTTVHDSAWTGGAKQSQPPAPPGPTPLPAAATPYNGFADGPILQSTIASVTEVHVTFANAAGLRLAGSYNCTECCTYNRTFEVSYDQATWLPVTSFHAVGDTDIVLSLAPSQGRGPAAPVSVLHAHQNYPECVLLNDNGIPTAPFLTLINDIKADKRASSDTKANGVALTPPMGFVSIPSSID